MKSYLVFFIIILFLSAGFAQGATGDETPAPEKQTVLHNSPDQPDSAAHDKDDVQAKAPEKKADAPATGYNDDEDYNDDDTSKKDKAGMTDPIEPFNRTMHTFNDKMYFWLLKPAAVGYKTVLPEPARVSVKNFFSNLRFPARFVSCLLQTDFSGAATEAGRFAINTVWGIGGLMDPAAGGELNLQMQDTDLGQTLGVYGVGHGFYIVWPFFGPSSPRDTTTIIGNQVLYPLSYYQIWYASIAFWGVESVNKISLSLTDYESIVNAAIDPYIAFRDAYAQYQMQAIKARKAKSLLFKDAQDVQPRTDEAPKK